MRHQATPVKNILRVHDWDEHQSYRKDRGQPPWIKVHRSLMRDAKWVQLSDAERGQLVSMWMLAADNNGDLPNNSALIAKLCFMEQAPNLEKFIDLGLFDDANVTPEWRQCDANVTHQSRGEERRIDKRRVEEIREEEKINFFSDDDEASF